MMPILNDHLNRQFHSILFQYKEIERLFKTRNESISEKQEIISDLLAKIYLNFQKLKQKLKFQDSLKIPSFKFEEKSMILETFEENIYDMLENQQKRSKTEDFKKSFKRKNNQKKVTFSKSNISSLINLKFDNMTLFGYDDFVNNLSKKKKNDIESLKCIDPFSDNEENIEKQSKTLYDIKVLKEGSEDKRNLPLFKKVSIADSLDSNKNLKYIEGTYFFIFFINIYSFPIE